MKILYGFSNCSDKKYEQIFSDKTVSVLRADQKYHGLLIKGLKENGADVYCVSGLPINRSVTKKLFISEKDEVEDGVFYHYIDTVNLPLFRQLGIYTGSRHSVKKAKKRESDCFIICDCLNLANAFGMLKGAKKRKIPIVFIVTDLPEFQRTGFLKKINYKLFKKADGFIFLTEQMNERVNILHKPYVVLEGHADCSLKSVDDAERYEYQNGKKVVIYAGSIQKLYGIQNLVEGFIKADIENAELQIFGDGDYREELESVAEKHHSVKYMGIKPNAEIVKAEQCAALLVNPRPVAPEYTKYSFPSKNMEYMASGTPVLTTELPGMPKEYYPYIFTIKNDNADGIANALKDVFALDVSARYLKGRSAREFVLREKSNVVQAKKILEFLRKEIKEKD
ncbi:MAG: glycosyltransferase [Clostridia bacterium]|nr:glycosyltransferase [Clostridia bacterium]